MADTMSLMSSSRTASSATQGRDARSLERTAPADWPAAEQSAHKACLETIRELREENAVLRQSADQFAALAERLQTTLRNERSKTARDQTSPRTVASDPASISTLIEAEYRAIPNLRLTRWQAARLWNLDQTLCDAAISALLEKRILRETSGGFVRLDH